MQIIAAEPTCFTANHLLGAIRFQQGRNAEALQLIGTALKTDPDAIEALSFYGLVLQTAGRPQEALASYDKALALEPGNAATLYNRGTVLQGLKRFAEALASYDKALAIKPDFVVALNNRGITQQALKQFAEALVSYDRALVIKRDYAEAWNNRGNALQGLERFEEALASYDRALTLKPGHAEAWGNRGDTLQYLKRFDEALASCDKALAIKPNHAEAWTKRGTVLQTLKRFDEAMLSYEKALTIKPDHDEAWNNRGNTLQSLGRGDEALVSFDRALAIKPDFAEGLYNRGNTLSGSKRHEEALASYDRALAIKPDHAASWNGRGSALWEMKRIEEALGSYDKALAINPDYAEAWYNRGNAAQSLRRYAEALANYEKTLAIDPGHLHAFGGVLNTILNLCDWPRTAKIADEIRAQIAARTSIIPPFTLLGYSGDAALHLQCAENYIQNRIPVRPQPLWDKTVYHNDKVKIAYLSADFHIHPVAHLIAELFERHDRSRFEVIAVSLGPDDGSKMRARLVKAFDKFLDVRGRSDHEVASLLRASKVDIAIDLNGYTTDARPEILSYRPCPVQVNYLGYPGTMGADFIDYVIADKIVLPLDQQPFFSEKIVHLPYCYQANDSKRTIAEETPTRADCGLPEQGFVFCCFNNGWKTTAPVFDTWMRLLTKVPGSVLWLLEDNSGATVHLQTEAAARGIDPQRLVFAARVPLEKHLARHRLADLFLDTLPYNAHTTASDALWVGLPLVTCRGEAFPGRVAASLLNAVGLPELATDSLEAYEALALQLARDASLLQSVRHRLKQNRLTHPLFDADRFRRNIEAAYTQMWQIAQHGEAPRSFSVPLDA